jgi:hypothetical protein
MTVVQYCLAIKRMNYNDKNKSQKHYGNEENDTICTIYMIFEKRKIFVRIEIKSEKKQQVVGTGNWLKRNIRKFLGCKKVAVS